MEDSVDRAARADASPDRLRRLGGTLALPVLWAAGCALLATGTRTLEGLTALRVLGAWLVADVGLGGVWSQLATLKAC
ncbi:MAG: hypothetical protein GX557_13095 [Chloroflexi bacterium]|nr:hypothetical protein [Chloroflexota bacterium]